MHAVFYVLITLTVIVVLYLMVSLAYVKRRKQSFLDMQDNLSVGDDVRIANAIFGTVVKLTKDTAEVEIAKGVVVTADRAAVFGAVLTTPSAKGMRNE